MEKCPYCENELSLKLSMMFISEIDQSVFKVQSRIIENMPRLFQGFMRGAVSNFANRPIPVFVISCRKCSTALDFEFTIHDE